MKTKYVSIKQGKDHVSTLAINKQGKIIVLGAIQHAKRLRFNVEDIPALKEALDNEVNQFMKGD